MYESTSQRNKAIWVGSLALLTVGSVLYFTMLRKPEDSSKPNKDTKTREVIQERSVKTSQIEVKDDVPQPSDVPQTKATVTLKEEITETVDISAEPVHEEKNKENDHSIAATSTAAAAATAAAVVTTAASLMTSVTENTTTPVEQQQKIDQVAVEEEKEQVEEEEKSPLLTAAPSSSTSSDISNTPLNESSKTPLTPSSLSNGNLSNGVDVNGYWQPPAANVTFQHSMGWPELFPLQQQQQSQQSEEVKHIATDVNDTTVLGNVASTTAPAAEKKRPIKKRMTRLEQIDQQRQNYVPTMKSRCNWWPNCTNKNCKYHHPHQPCRYGDMCLYNERCMFLHPWDYEEPVRHVKQQYQQPQHTEN